MAGEETLWLVKSSGRILGPFTASRVGEMLKTREVSVLDEVSPPLRRWQTIQYHESFREIIERLRKANLAETTDPTWTPGRGLTGITQTATDTLPSDLTDEITSSLTGFTTTAKEIVIHDVKEEPRPATTAGGAGRFQTQSGHNTAIQQQVEKTTRGLWIVTIVVLALVAAFVMQKRLGIQPGDGNLSPAALKQAVNANITVGQYGDALRLLKLNIPDPAQAGDLAIYYGALLIQVENQTTIGKRILNTIVVAKKPEAKLAYAGLGIADLIDGQLDSAQENFDRAVALDAAYVAPVVNSAAVALQRGDYARARAHAVKALQLAPNQGEALLTLAQAELYLFKSKGSAAELARSHSMIREYVARRWDFMGEIGFYGLFFDFLKRDPNLDDRIREYLDRDPELTADHRHNVFIYRGHTQWKVLGRFCEQMAEKIGLSVRSSTLLASCYAQEGRWDQARQQIEKAVNQAPKDALVQAWYSYILQKSGDATEASVVLARANESNRRGEYVLPALLQARWCETKDDIECAGTAWKKIYGNNLDSLPAIAGLARYQTAKKIRDETNRMIEKGLKISPDYIPLLLLRQRGEKEGWYASN